MAVRVARIYDEAGEDDGFRVLVDRAWPRGIRRDTARIDLWLPEVAPSTDLRKWFRHEPERFAEFARRYRQELATNPAKAQLVELTAHHPTITLLYGARDRQHNQAVVLAEMLTRSPGSSPA